MTRRGRIGTMLAGLLVMASLAFAAVPVAAWPPPAEGHGHHAAPAHAGHESGASDHAAPAHAALDHTGHESGAGPARHGGDRPPGGTHPALACCVAMHCPMMTGGLPDAPAQPRPAVEPAVRSPVPARRLAGLSVPPALPPPRAAVV